jgi:prevent-host-death family protein
MATTVSIQEAKAQLTELIHLAEQGEEIVIAQDDQPKVKLVPIPPKKTGKRVFGEYQGKIRMSEDFNDPRTYALTAGRNCGLRYSLPEMKLLTNDATTSLYKSRCHW